MVFGVYAVAVLTALLTVGSLSDHVGRRPVLLTAVALQAATLIVFVTAGGVPELLVARSCWWPGSSRVWPPVPPWGLSEPASST
jgi:MFS family permease